MTEQDAKLGAELLAAVKSGLHAAVKEKLCSSYGSPLEGLLQKVIAENTEQLKALLVSSVVAAIGDPEFREQIRAALRTKLAKTLIERFGGELEKQVNTLKSDPATRARLTVAIEEIVATAAKS